MSLLKFVKYFCFIKLYFNRLPVDIQCEIVDIMENYYYLARIAKYVDLNKEVINECTRKNC